MISNQQKQRSMRVAQTTMMLMINQALYLPRYEEKNGRQVRYPASAKIPQDAHSHGLQKDNMDEMKGEENGVRFQPTVSLNHHTQLSEVIL